ncbi:StAR-related lipid transfer protein 3 [Toxocara canis]|uniref:StAR-related lipid transfer protein 3 n=1 Tax=Toxocara canis TaxID=6265 RepID=A0A0B2VKN2_TOXCA|nr:StAR-related lipid transfer protein 3 [Toxocara canis]
MSSIDDPLLNADAGMGKDRRRFLIVSVFDFCLIVLLWLICTVTKGNDWATVFLREVDIFEAQFMKISLFDIVIIAVCRMLVLVFSYAVLLVDHWIPVAITTIVTTLFLVIKVLFFFSRDQGSLPQYLVILSSFTVAWFELWLVPFRVLPRERRQAVAPEIESPAMGTMRVRNAQTDDEFRSAMEYSSGSDAEDDRAGSNLLHGKVYSKAEYIEAADRAEQTARQYLSQVDSWRVICRDNPEIRYCEEKRVYYVQVEVQCSPQSLFKAIWKDNQLWNKQVVEMRVLLHIDSTTELLYSVTAPALRGYISSRFVAFLPHLVHHIFALRSVSLLFSPPLHHSPPFPLLSFPFPVASRLDSFSKMHHNIEQQSGCRVFIRGDARCVIRVAIRGAMVM